MRGTFIVAPLCAIRTIAREHGLGARQLISTVGNCDENTLPAQTMEGSLESLLADAMRHVDTMGDSDMRLALQCGLAAGAYIRQGWEGGLGSLGVKDKGVGDLVSVVDVNAERAVLDLLQAKLRYFACCFFLFGCSSSCSCVRDISAPNDLVLSEETQQGTKPQAGRRMWIVDPLDGTACFVFHTQPELCSTLIALYDCDLGRVTHGVEVFPIGRTPRAVYARLGKGAFVNGTKLSVPSEVCVPLQRAWVNLNHYSDVTFESKFFSNLRTNLRTPGTACRMVTTYPATSGVACQILLGDSRMSAVVHDNDARNVKVRNPLFFFRKVTRCFISPSARTLGYGGSTTNRGGSWGCIFERKYGSALRHSPAHHYRNRSDA